MSSCSRKLFGGKRRRRRREQEEEKEEDKQPEGSSAAARLVQHQQWRGRKERKEKGRSARENRRVTAGPFSRPPAAALTRHCASRFSAAAVAAFSPSFFFPLVVPHFLNQFPPPPLKTQTASLFTFPFASFSYIIQTGKPGKTRISSSYSSPIYKRERN